MLFFLVVSESLIIEHQLYVKGEVVRLYVPIQVNHVFIEAENGI